jgi:predicted flap endonuclease-1-like 5' DNA nuclease
MGYLISKIVICLLLAFLLGLVNGWLLRNQVFRSREDTLVADSEGLSETIEILEREHKEMRNNLQVMERDNVDLNTKLLSLSNDSNPFLSGLEPPSTNFQQTQNHLERPNNESGSTEDGSDPFGFGNSNEKYHADSASSDNESEHTIPELEEISGEWDPLPTELDILAGEIYKSSKDSESSDESIDTEEPNPLIEQAPLDSTAEILDQEATSLSNALDSTTEPDSLDSAAEILDQETALPGNTQNLTNTDTATLDKSGGEISKAANFLSESTDPDVTRIITTEPDPLAFTTNTGNYAQNETTEDPTSSGETYDSPYSHAANLRTNNNATEQASSSSIENAANIQHADLDSTRILSSETDFLLADILKNSQEKTNEGHDLPQTNTASFNENDSTTKQETNILTESTPDNSNADADPDAFPILTAEPESFVNSTSSLNNGSNVSTEPPSSISNAQESKPTNASISPDQNEQTFQETPSLVENGTDLTLALKSSLLVPSEDNPGEQQADILLQEFEASSEYDHPLGDIDLTELNTELLDAQKPPRNIPIPDDIGALLARTGDYDIEEIEGIGKGYSRRLRDIGISSTRKLLSRGIDSDGISDIAKQVNNEEFVIRSWVSMADLIRVSGIRGQFAELLVTSGIKSVQQLAKQDSAQLIEKLTKTITRENRKRAAPTIEMAIVWTAAAKNLPSIIHPEV